MSYGMMIPLGATELLIATVVFIVSCYFITAYNKMKKPLPPGPIGLPLVGYLPYLKKDPHVKLRDIASKYGDVFSLKLGSQLVVVLNGVDAIREGLNKPEFLGRPPQGAFNFIPEIPSIVSISGKPFQEQRRFILSCLRDLGLGKTALEECMKNEIEYFLKVLDEWNGEPHEVKTILTPSMSNNIMSLICGRRFDYEDPRRKPFDSNRRIITKFFAQTSTHIFFPWVKHLPFVNKYLGYDQAVQAFDALLDFYKEQIHQHKSSLDPANTRDFIDKFLVEMQEVKERNDTRTSFTENMLVGNAGTLLGAGSDTVRNAVDWCLYIMAAYQSIQNKVHQEISSVVGLERMPSYSDHKHMPFTQAVIMEVMRWKTIASLNLLRYTFEDTTLRGYYIPRNTVLLANIWSAHYDPRYWEEPEVFNPERFLSSDGEGVIKTDAYMPFSTGRRACPGEPMAVVEIFIYFTAILQKFNIQLQDGDVPDLEGILTVTYMAKPHKLRFLRRS